MAYIGTSPTKVVSRQSANIFTYQATANQTAFTGSDANGNTLACTPSDIMVHMNGLRLEKSDYVATTTTVTLGSGAAAGDEVTITAFLTFERDAAVTNVADNVVDEANLKVSNTPTNGYFLSAQSGNTGGLTWSAIPAGVGGATGVDFNDNVKARFGTGNDLEIYHNGTNNIIDSNTGNLEITSDAFYVNNAANNEVLIKALNGGAVSLYHDNSKKLETTSGGVGVTGDLTTTSNVGCSGNGSFGSTSSSGYRLLYYTGGMYAGSDINLQANISGSNANITCYNLTVFGTFSNYSDDRLKDKIGNISTPLDKISTLNGFYYTDSETVTDIKKSENLQDPTDTHQKKESQQKVGLSAQQVQAVLPEVVKTSKAADSETDTEYLTLDYTRVIPLLVEGIKELKTKVETLETKVAALEGG